MIVDSLTIFAERNESLIRFLQLNNYISLHRKRPHSSSSSSIVNDRLIFLLFLFTFWTDLERLRAKSQIAMNWAGKQQMLNRIGFKLNVNELTMSLIVVQIDKLKSAHVGSKIVDSENGKIQRWQCTHRSTKIHQKIITIFLFSEASSKKYDRKKISSFSIDVACFVVFGWFRRLFCMHFVCINIRENLPRSWDFDLLILVGGMAIIHVSCALEISS